MPDLRALLPRTFGAFLSRFKSPTQIQLAAIPALVAGRDALLCSPTATGKTEAYAAPAAELALAARSDQVLVLLISPTRALANDLKRRLESPMQDLNISFGRYTGEHKERQGGKLPQIVISTPEALDSLLARRPGAIRSTRLIVLDEINILDGTPRGDQLRMLLWRLDLVCGRRVQKVAASATINQADELAARYLQDAFVAEVGTRRRITARAFPGTSASAMAEHLDHLARHGFRKILVFCNRRADVENYASKLKGRTRFQDLVLPHHGSLSQRIRERTEKRFLEAPAAVAFATLTLEMGIDMGSIDYVLLAAPPADVASTLQRIGRGGRRGDTTRAGYAVESAGDRLRFRTLFRCGAKGDLKGTPYALRPGILVQQALVLAASEGWIDAQRLAQAMPAAIGEAIAPTTTQEIMQSMQQKGLLERQPGQRYVLTEAWEARYDRGTLHSNIAAELTTEIVDRLTGDVVGTLGEVDQKKFRLGGQGRRVVLTRPGRILSDATNLPTSSAFASKGAPQLSLALARCVLADLGLPGHELWQVADGSQHVLLHGLGTVGSMILTSLIRQAQGEASVLAGSAFALHLARPLSELPECSLKIAAELVHRRKREFVTLCGMGPHHRHLPEDLGHAALLQACDLEGLVSFLELARLRQAERDEFDDWDATLTL